MNGEIFLTCLEKCLVPTLSPGEIVSMESLPAHKVAVSALFGLANSSCEVRMLNRVYCLADERAGLDQGSLDQ